MAFEIHTHDALPILRVAPTISGADLVRLADGRVVPSISGGMANVIYTKFIPGEFPVAWPHYFTVADQTVTTTITTAGFGDLLAGTSEPGGFVNRWWIMAKIKLKTSTVGTSVLYALEVDSATGFATNLQNIGEDLVTAASTNATRWIAGFMDDAATPVARYYRIKQTITGGGAATFDAAVYATPIG